MRATSHHNFSPRALLVLIKNEHASLTSNLFVDFNPISCSLNSFSFSDEDIVQIYQLPLLSSNSHDFIKPVIYLTSTNEVKVYPQSSSSSRSLDNIYFFTKTFLKNSLFISGYRFKNSSVKEEDGKHLNGRQEVSHVWQVELCNTCVQSETSVSTFSKHIHHIALLGRVMSDRSVVYKYLHPNLLVVAVCQAKTESISLYLLDAITGTILHSVFHRKALGPFNLVHYEHVLVYVYWNSKFRRQEIVSLHLYSFKPLPKNVPFSSHSSLCTSSKSFYVETKAYVFPHKISHLSISETKYAVSKKNLLLAFPYSGIYQVSEESIDPLLPHAFQKSAAGGVVIPAQQPGVYIPEIGITALNFVNESVHHVKQIHSTYTALESTSLIFAHGIDLYFNRILTSGSFDTLHSNFDHRIILIVLVAIIILTLFVKRISDRKELFALWKQE